MFNEEMEVQITEKTIQAVLTSFLDTSDLFYRTYLGSGYNFVFPGQGLYNNRIAIARGRVTNGKKIGVETASTVI